MSRRPAAPPIEFPLPGAEPGASMTLRPLLCAEMGMPPNWFHRKRGLTETLKAFGVGVRASHQMTIPIPAYLLEHPRAGRELVVMTHLHFDHASALADFPSATVLVDAREWSGAWARDSLLHGYSQAQLDPRPRYRTIDFSGPSVTANGPFERTIDVWGDGALTLVSTQGHTVGHLSLIVRLAGGEALLTADAAYTLATIRHGERPWLTHNRRAFERSLEQVQAYDRENPNAIVIPGHDQAAWNDACERLWAVATDPRGDLAPTAQAP